MAQVEQELCDGCGALITGKKGVVFQRNPGIIIKGQISVLEVDEATKWREHMYVTPGADCNLSFCNLDCLSIYISAHTLIAKSRIREKMQREAAGEQDTRMRKDPDFVVGRKPNYGHA